MGSMEKAAQAGRLAAGTVWAGVLMLTGLSVLSAGRGAAGIDVLALWGGVAAVAAAQFVFLTVVADRLCPMKNRRLPDALTLFSAGVFASALLGFLFMLFGGSR